MLQQLPCRVQNTLYAKTEQPCANYVYAYSNAYCFRKSFADPATFQGTFFVKFKILGLTIEPGLATKIRANALSSK